MKTLRSRLSFFAVLLSILFFTSAANAQCPSDIPPIGIPWTHAAIISYSVPGSGCTGTIDYCYRKLLGWPSAGQTTYQTVVLSFTTSGCNNVDPLDLLNAVSEAIFNDDLLRQNINDFPPCNEQYSVQRGQSYRPCCWKKLSGGGFIPCGSGDPRIYCVYACDICNNNGNFYRFNCTFTETGTPSCADGESPTKIGDWVAGDCMHVACGPRP